MAEENTQTQIDENRRCQERLPYRNIQQIAPLRGETMPDSGDFFEVGCFDLTTRGLSFFMGDTPDFNELVVAFESPEKTVYVRAEVRHHRDVLVYESTGRVETLDGYAICGDHLESQASPQTFEAGTPMVLVGCCFMGRVE